MKPLILLNGHVCTILSLGKPSVGGLGSEGADFLLQEPYAWESDEEAEGFVLPPWMWDAVGGEMVSRCASSCARGEDDTLVPFAASAFGGGCTRVVMLPRFW